MEKLLFGQLNQRMNRRRTEVLQIIFTLILLDNLIIKLFIQSYAQKRVKTALIIYIVLKKKKFFFYSFRIA